MSRGLGWKEKVGVYAMGLVLGIVLVSLIQRERRSGEESGGRFLGKAIESMIESSGLRNLPEGSPDYLRESRLLDYLLTLPDASGRFEYIWILEVEEGYPRVRVIEQLEQRGPEEPWVSQGFSIMAADQVLVQPAPGVEPEALDPYLQSLSWSRGDFFAGPQAWVVQLDESAPLSVPKAIRRLAEAEELVQAAFPLIIHWK